MKGRELEEDETGEKLKLIFTMIIFGTIGIFVRFIPFSSGLIAGVRGIIGTLFLIIFVKIKGEKISYEAIKNNFKILCISGILIGANWILLFEAYNYTTVATATLCYYLAPVFIIILSPAVLKEKLTLKKGICTLTALMGMFFISGVMRQGGIGNTLPKGIIYGVGAAVLYACVVLLNKFLKNISAYEITIVQLFIAALTVIPHLLFTEKMAVKGIITPQSILLLIIVGTVHTGITYAMYFSTIKTLKAQTVAIFSYIDPVVAIFLSTFLL
ncbi:MAG: DMT family transporter, partial [Leptotrichiaceae bacterium]|nr:DMT family transporter [Leptotrichiaceae bacterium]